MHILYASDSNDFSIVGAPCLSFDIIKDPLGDNRGEDYPMTMYMVAGTQAERAHVNNVIVIKMSNLTKTKEKSKNEDDEEEESEDEEDEEDKPELEAAMIKHDTGGVNRVRVSYQQLFLNEYDGK